MPRVRVRKTSRGLADLSVYKEAYDEVKLGASLRKAAEKYGLNHVSLLRYSRKRNACGEEEIQRVGYRAHNRVFNTEQEQELSKYLIQYAEIYVGVSEKEVRQFAYELTNMYKLSRPQTWDDNKMAGEEWLRMFMRRNPELSTHITNQKSLMSNRNNADSFYDNLSTILNRHKLDVQEIHNAEETAVTTVQKPDRVVATPEKEIRDNIKLKQTKAKQVRKGLDEGKSKRK